MFPGVMFMVNHCGLPYERDTQTMKIWREGSRTTHKLQTSLYIL
jgi:predicted TIM-barrel fold metal-dependent hydrolase